MVAVAALARGGGVGRDGAGNIVAADLAGQIRLRERVRAAIGVGHRLAAGPAPGEAVVDAIAVRLIGEDEQAFLGVRGGPEMMTASAAMAMTERIGTPSAAKAREYGVATKPNNATLR